jgi:predicted alpha/beta-fold hydrolase
MNHFFTPPRLIENGHAQTIWPAVFRRGTLRGVLDEVWRASDGEALDIALLPIKPGRPGVLVLHGLEGSSRSAYVRGVLAGAQGRGWNGAALEFRSCGRSPVLGTRLYHSGDTRDLPVVLTQLRARWQGPIGAVGFSLGGNVLLKWLGDEGDRAAVDAAAAVSAPFDLAACAAALDGPGFFPALYRRRFLRTLRRKALAVAARHPGALDAAAMRGCRTFARFDDLFTAPLFGFDGAADYWARCSSTASVPRIRRPTLVISAEDDPIVPAQALPRAALAANPAITAHILPRGGHVGFVAAPIWRPRYAAEAAVLAFLEEKLASRPSSLL